MKESVNVPLLKINSLEGQYNEYALKFGANLIGRFSNEMAITDEINYIGLISKDTKMSRKHFGIDWNINAKGENYLLIYDNFSANRTYLKGFGRNPLHPEDRVYLAHNDEIIVGDTSIFIQIPLSLMMNKVLIIERIEEDVKTMIWGLKK